MDPSNQYSFYKPYGIPAPQYQYYYNPYIQPIAMPQFQQFNYNFQRYPYMMSQDQIQIPKPQPQPIVISDDEDEQPTNIPEKIQKTSNVQVQQQQPKKQVKVLDLDQLENQGRVYDFESSESPQLPRRSGRHIRYEQQYQSPKKKYKQYKPKKEQTRYRSKIIKHVQIGKDKQQLYFEQSDVKTRLIRVYTKNEDKFTNLFELLKTYCPNQHINDEDVIRILNVVGKDYEKAEEFIKEKSLSIQYFIETYQNKELSDDESTNKK